MTDLFHEWKKQRFVVVPPTLLDGIPFGPVVLMCDFKFWSENADECAEWCQQHQCRIKGMTIEMPNEETLTLFSLRWSG